MRKQQLGVVGGAETLASTGQVLGSIWHANASCSPRRSSCIPHRDGGLRAQLRSAEFERLRQVLEGALEDPDTSLYEIGFDNGQMYAFRDWSSGILGIRCALPLFHVLQLFDVMYVVSLPDVVSACAYNSA